MDVLVIRVHGFVGSDLVKALSPENTVCGLDIVAPEKDGIVKTFSWDDLDSIDLPQIDAVIHLTGKAHDTRNGSAADVYFKVNTDLTQRIFDWFLSNESTKKFMLFSAIKSASDKVEGKCLTEEYAPTPVGPYGESKIKAKDYIIGHFAPEILKCPYYNLDDGDLLVKGKNMYIIRPCMIHGPGNKGNLNLFYGVVNKEIPWPLGAFENRRSFTSIRNLCVVINESLTKNIPSSVYRMGDDEALSANKLIQVICEALGKRVHMWHIPKGLINGVAKVGGWFHLPLNPLKIRKFTENYVVSNAKIKAALGITWMPIRMKDGLVDTIRSFKQQNDYEYILDLRNYFCDSIGIRVILFQGG